MKKLFIMMFVLGAMFSVLGCGNTADGVVEDTENAIDAVKDAIN